MKANASRQYTIRNIPDSVDSILRQRARETDKSFNQVALEALMAGVGESLRPKRNFTGIAGTLPAEEAACFDAEIERQRQVDPELWK